MKGFAMTKMLFLVGLLCATLALPVMAQTPPPPPPATPTNPAPPTDQVCTDFATRMAQIDTANPSGTGLLTDIYYYIKTIVDNSTYKLYQAFIDSTGYQTAVYGALSLTIVIFAVSFLIGAIQPSFGQVLIRLVKIGLIFTLVGGTGWTFFNDTVVEFFNNGTNDLIRGVMQISMPISNAPAGASPFFQLDNLAAFILHPDTIIAILGMTFSSGPFGAGMAALMLASFWTFVMLLVNALRVYAVSYVARSLLLGLGPVFIVFFLFERTKQLFMSWVNALISLALQPILLFTFLSFFLVLITSAAKDVLSVDLCWTEYTGANGSDNKLAFWRFVDTTNPDKDPISSKMDWNGWFSCTVTGKTDCPEFPINVVDLLTFLILVYLANRFSKIIERVAGELSNTFISLDTQGRLDDFMKQQQPPQQTASINPNRGTVKR